MARLAAAVMTIVMRRMLMRFMSGLPSDGWWIRYGRQWGSRAGRRSHQRRPARAGAAARGRELAGAPGSCRAGEPRAYAVGAGRDWLGRAVHGCLLRGV